MTRLSCQFRVNCITKMNKKNVLERRKSALTKRLKYLNDGVFFWNNVCNVVLCKDFVGIIGI